MNRKSETGDTVAERVQRWVRREIRELSAYHVPDAGGLIKLDAMENPYGWPEPLVDAWLERLRAAPLNRYPDPAARALTQRLRDAMQIPVGAGLLLGNGSDELIQMVVMAIAGEGRTVLAPEPTFVMYRMIADFAGMRYAGVPLREDFTLDLPAMLAAIDAHQPAVVFLAYPNNPTGNLFDRAAIEQVIAASPGLVVVDEAYAPFARETFLSQLHACPNLLVMRTVSKLGLAGLRLGLLAGAPAWLDEFDKIRLPYNINVLTQLSADFALEHLDVFEEQAGRIRSDRDSLIAAMQEIATLEVFPSDANFILFRTVAGRAGAIHAAIRDAGVLIKNLDSDGPLRDCLRVTVGTPEENQAFLAALQAAV